MFFTERKNFMLLARIKELREKHGLSQKKLAELLEMHTTQYQRYETGERAVPIDFLIQLANFYDVSLDYLVGRSDETGTAENESIG